ncbi:MAG: glycerophosphodiester phosphodiesterase family protein [Candidatus Gracilibacteria bacterium]|jgi:glycerophosphoryl diester phosphodiesterase
MLKIAHRGAKLQATENTLAAFAAAIKSGADMVELDVHLSKDGQIVVIHDPTLERTTNGQGFVCDLTLAQIQSFKTQEGESIPTLEQVFKLCKGKIKILVEIKSLNCVEQIAKLIKEYNNHALHRERRELNSSEIVVQSFLHGELLEFRKFDQVTPTAILFDELLIDGRVLSKYLQKMQAQGVNMNYKKIHPQLLQTLHQNQQFVYAWGMEEKDVPALEKMGIDGVTLAL